MTDGTLHVVLALVMIVSIGGCSDGGDKSDIGGSCSNNTDCADSICHAGICVSRHPLKNGSPCKHLAYCQSLKCEGGTCVQNALADGVACLNDAECASGACTGGICLSPTRPDAGPAADAGPGGDGAVGADGEPASDVSPPDATWTCQDALGKPCTSLGGECGPAGTCLVTDAVKSRGVCTCVCTPDDPTTSASEDDCPSQSICGEAGGKNYCFRKCTPKLGLDECEGELACSPGSVYLAQWAWAAVCAYHGCTKDSDCLVRTGKTCDVSVPNSCAAGELCSPIATGLNSGRCAKAGKCDAKSGLCAPHGLGKATAKVGDPCKADTECGDKMFCAMELDESKHLLKSGAACTWDEQCCSGVCSGGSCAKGACKVRRRNGYCSIYGCSSASTLTDRACPAGSTCNHNYAGGLCQKTCSLTSAKTCRGVAGDLLGDYECQAWNNQTSYSGLAFTSGPVCDFGTRVSCAYFAATGGGCYVLGDATNSTKMSCRGLDGIPLANKFDPDGFCLDDTASGPKKP